MLESLALFALLVLVAVATSCSGPTPAETKASDDAFFAMGAAKDTCDTFHQAAVDIADGQLTDNEVRTRIRDVADKSELAASEVRSPARESARLLTEGAHVGDPPVEEQFRLLSKACDRVLGR